MILYEWFSFIFKLCWILQHDHFIICWLRCPERKLVIYSKQSMDWAFIKKRMTKSKNKLKLVSARKSKTKSSLRSNLQRELEIIILTKWPLDVKWLILLSKSSKNTEVLSWILLSLSSKKYWLESMEKILS